MKYQIRAWALNSTLFALTLITANCTGQRSSEGPDLNHLTAFVPEWTERVFKEGEVYFALDQASLRCESDESVFENKTPEEVAFHCLKKTCQSTPGAYFDGDALECVCSNGGIFRSEGSRGDCILPQYSANLGTWTLGLKTVQSDLPEASQILAAVTGETPKLNFLGGIEIFTTGSRIRAMEASSVKIERYQKLYAQDGYVPDDVLKGHSVAWTTYYLAADQSLPQALRPSRNYSPLASFKAPILVADPSFAEAIERAVWLLADLRSLSVIPIQANLVPTQTGCGAGCKITFNLGSVDAAFTAELVRQYFLGSVVSEEVRILDQNSKQQATLVLFPGRMASYLRIENTKSVDRDIYDHRGQLL